MSFYKEKLIERYASFFFIISASRLTFFLIAWLTILQRISTSRKDFWYQHLVEDLISVTDPNINVIGENSINRSSYLSVSSMMTAKIIVDTHEQAGSLRLTLSSAVICLQDTPKTWVWVLKVNIS